MAEVELDQVLSPKPQTDLPESIKSPSSTAPADQPRTLGGFIVDDDEDEGGVPQPEVQTDGMINTVDVDRRSSNTPPRSLLHSPQHAHSTSDVSIQANAENQDQTAVTPNGAADDVPNVVTVPPVDDASKEVTATEPSQVEPNPSQRPSTAASVDSAKPFPKARLPHDRIGILEDRIKEDPRGDVDAWLTLIGEHKRRNKLEDVRNTYKRFFEIFPNAAEQWVAYATTELDSNNFWEAEQIFSRSLVTVPNLSLWTTYLNYVRRRNNLTTDVSGQARKTVSEAYAFVLDNLGIDKDAGALWQDYIQFIRSGPGQVGGNQWQDQQKMDDLRKAYQRAVCIPTQSVSNLWKEYDAFEMSLNKMTGRKFLQEKSPSYVTARSCSIYLQNLTRELNRSTLPVLPPALGFDGDAEYMRQVEIWKKWIDWEKEDPLVLREEDEKAYKGRIIYVYKQAVMSMRFWPELWFDAADFCFNNGLDKDGDEFLERGVNANPESCLLAFKRGDRIESTTYNAESDESIKTRGENVRAPYDKVLDALYELAAKVKQREAQALTRIEEQFLSSEAPSREDSNDEDDDEEGEQANKAKEAQKKVQIETVQRGNAAHTRLLHKSITFVWIALMRAMRRVQGKGKPDAFIGGSRHVFADARKRGRLTSDIYVASALLEHHCYKDVAATRIFERGMKLFPEDEAFALEYLKHLLDTNDVTNARAVFEATVNRLGQKPETLPKAKPVYAFFHEYESQYGELSQVKNLEKRINDLFPGESKMALFSHRFARSEFEPTAIRHIISPGTQARPKALPPIEGAASTHSPPRHGLATPSMTNNSPKRPLEESDNEGMPPRKMVRGESPLKGAAGRRLDAQKRTHLRNEVNQNGGGSSAPPGQLPLPPPPPSQATLPREVMFLLSIIPPAEKYDLNRFSPEGMVNLLRRIEPSRANLSNELNQGQGAPPAPMPTPMSNSVGMGMPMGGQMQMPPQISQMQTPHYGYAPSPGSMNPAVYGFPR